MTLASPLQMIEPAEAEAAQRLAVDRVTRIGKQRAERAADDIEMQLERIAGDFLARSERILDIAIEARERDRRRIGIDPVARVVRTAQRQALIVVEQHERRAGRQQQREIPAAAAAEHRHRCGCRRRTQQHRGQHACRVAARPWRGARRNAPARRRRDRSACSRSRARTRAADRDAGSRHRPTSNRRCST